MYQHYVVYKLNMYLHNLVLSFIPIDIFLKYTASGLQGAISPIFHDFFLIVCQPYCKPFKLSDLYLYIIYTAIVF